MFISRSSLWTDFGCGDEEKVKVYLERSRSTPVNVSLRRDKGLFPFDPFFQIIPLVIGRLKSLYIQGTRENLEAITAHLTHPVPLLEDLSIYGGPHRTPNRNPVLAPTLFNGDFSSLRELGLQSVHTKLPWRNMVNLTWFSLTDTSSVPMRQLLDFLESAPHLRKVDLTEAPISGTQNGRLVSLACLKRMAIMGGPSSVLLDHMLIPVGAKLTTQVKLPGVLIEDHLPRSLDNLKNLSGFTKIQLSSCGGYPHIKFSGPNGQVKMASDVYHDDETRMLFKSLSKFDTSKIKQLEIDSGDSPSSDHLYRALLPMEDLLILTLSLCVRPRVFIHALDPSMSSPGVLVCPKLEEIVIEHIGSFDIESILGVAAARASRGAKLKLVRIVNRGDYMGVDVSELKKHVSRVECSREVDDGGFSSDEED